MNRNYFDPKAKVDLPEWKLELWPGYVTTMRQHEQNVLLCCETTSKIIRTDTVYVQLKAGARDRDRVTKVLLGAIVLTRYNNKTYRIDEIAWDKKPADTFPKKDGSDMSYVQYYKERYQLDIKDTNQTLFDGVGS
jgi:aubergine-like protein